MVELTRISVRNFLSFGEFDFDLSKQGLLCLSGENRDISSADSNGAGKSNFFEAIYWGLFGKTLRGVKAADIVRRGANRGCCVEISFRHESGKEFKVRRYREDEDYGNGLFLEEGEADKRGQDKKETQGRIQVLIGMSADLFRHTILFGQGGLPRFSELGDAAKKSLIEEILDLSIYEKCASISRKRGSAAFRGLSDLRIKNEALQKRENDFKDRLLELETLQAEWFRNKNSTLERLRGKELALREKVELTKGEEREALREMKKLLASQVAEQDILYRENTEHEHRVMKSFLEKRGEWTHQISETRVLKKFLEEKKDRLEGLFFDGKCPTCGQDTIAIDPTELDGLGPAVLVEKKKIDSLEDNMGSLEAAKKKIDEEFSEKEYAIRNRKRVIEKEKERVESLLERSVPLVEVLSSLEDVKKEIQRVDDAQFSSSSRILVVQKELEQVHQELEGCILEEKKLETDAQKYTVLEKHVFGTQGIRSFIFETLLEEINQSLGLYAQVATGGQIQAELSPVSETVKGEERERLSLKIRNPTGGSSYEACSSGEKKRIDLPIALALQDLAFNRGLSLGICLFDEVFENVDETGADGVLRLLELSSQRENSRTVIAITHNPFLTSLFSENDILVSVKQNGVSLIESR